MSFFEKYADKIAPESNTGCWLWIGSWTSKGGYGNFRENNRSRYAHHAAFEEANAGVDHRGLAIRHKCDTPCCVNPNHLLLGTFLDNSRDMVNRGRSPNCRGDSAPKAKLTEADIPKIRARLAQNATTLNVADEFGVSRSTIYSIARRDTWFYVP